MSIPDDQSTDFGQVARKAKSAKLSAPRMLPHEHHGDRGCGNDTGLPRLPQFVRFRNLREASIVDSWQQLSQLIDRYGFPPGRLLSPNIRVWDIDDVRQWLANRPTERKTIVAPHGNKDAGESRIIEGRPRSPTGPAKFFSRARGDHQDDGK
jgi:hypothetical protein